jgi:hypothetical protein
METELFQDSGQIKREKYIYHHGPKHIPIICHLPDPPSFSLPTTFKGTVHREGSENLKILRHLRR